MYFAKIVTEIWSAIVAKYMCLRISCVLNVVCNAINRSVVVICRLLVLIVKSMAHHLQFILTAMALSWCRSEVSSFI